MGLIDRLAGAPISWGVCEVPGWGHELPRERVLAEMRELGLPATELGSDGYLPTDPVELRELCDRYDLRMIGGFVPVVIHDPDQRDATIDAVHRAATLMSGAGGTLFVSSPVTDWDWGPRPDIDALGWKRGAEMLAEIDDLVADYGMVQALHPHVGTIVESREDVERLLDLTQVGWTLDTGHLQIGGYDALQFTHDALDRIRHVHLKDVHLEKAAPVFARDRSIMQGVQDGMFCNLGEGDVPIADVVQTLESAGYDQWYVLEQDAALTDGEPPAGGGPLLDVRKSIEYLEGIETTVSA